MTELRGYMAPAEMAPVELTRAQKQALYRDGFVVLKGIVPKELTSRAKALLEEHERADTIAREGTASDRPNLTGAPEISDLLNESPLTPLLHATMGYFDPPKRAQVAVVHPSKPSKSFRTGHGYPEKDMPYGGWTPHCDGLFGAMLPPEVQAGHAEVSAKYTPQEIYDIIVNAAPRAPNIGRSPDVIGTNLCAPRLFFTALGMVSDDASSFAQRAAVRGSRHDALAWLLHGAGRRLPERPDEPRGRAAGAAPGRAPRDAALLPQAAGERRHHRSGGRGLAALRLLGPRGRRHGLAAAGGQGSILRRIQRDHAGRAALAGPRAHYDGRRGRCDHAVPEPEQPELGRPSAPS